MRTFRAKAISGGTWVYGYPVKMPVTPVLDPITYNSYIVSANLADYSADLAQGFDDQDFPKTAVDDSTLSQIVGILGKNAVTVYEGDIIIANIYPFENYNAVIEFNADKSRFEMRFVHKPTFQGRAIFDNNTRPLEFLMNTNIDIVGDIYSNPELL
ncbi:YopX family protein [Bacteroides sp.]|uniref:YopX family protein n=1 Tax=Bacteroides sp. TaxID=29523 RepID=UPI002630353B|nr:YopX family protein [Bacteroides sp.]MDD3039742.1 YopX family protein [Bacteroides sp.]